jgi:hypothetical protein
MTFTVKVRGAISQPMICVYTCPEHGEFDAEVQRDARGNSPDIIECYEEFCPDCGRVSSDHPSKIGDACPECPSAFAVCRLPATWTPSPTVACRVKRFEVVRGKWEKPERPTYLDTRKLGEGQSWDEFRKERAKVWEEKRQDDILKFTRDG